MNTRQQLITKHLDLAGCGLEIAPLFRPVVSKAEHNVYYTDYTSTEVLREKNATNLNAHSEGHPGIQTLDFVWTPGSRLSKAVPSGVAFDYAVASHVIEHVPNMVGWLNEILSVLKVGGKLALVVPNKGASFDYYRQDTPVSEFVDAWIRNASKPSPKQIFDCLSLATVDTDAPGTRSFDLHLPLAEAKRIYTLEEAFDHALNSFNSPDYLDVHCSAFTPGSFVNVIETLVGLGLLNVSLSAPEQGEPAVDHGTVSSEFMITLTKLGDPKIAQIPSPSVTVSGVESVPSASTQDLDHARNAFMEAVAVQEELKQRITRLEEQMGFVPAARRALLRLVGKS